MFRHIFASMRGAVNGKGYANGKSGVHKHLQVCQWRLRAPRVRCVNQASTTGLQPGGAIARRETVDRRLGTPVAVHRWVHLYVLLSDVG
jgi:hypothetical protein